MRALQRVPARAPERRAALTHLVLALRQLGLAAAADGAEAELAALGGPLENADAAPGGALSCMVATRSSSKSRRRRGRESSEAWIGHAAIRSR